MKLRITIGAIIKVVPSITAPAIMIRLRRFARPKKNRGNVQNKHRYRGLTRNQHATPRTKPAANAKRTLLRFAENRSSHNPPITNQVVGASADGATPTIASNGES